MRICRGCVAVLQHSKLDAFVLACNTTEEMVLGAGEYSSAAGELSEAVEAGRGHTAVGTEGLVPYCYTAFSTVSRPSRPDG